MSRLKKRRKTITTPKKNNKTKEKIIVFLLGFLLVGSVFGVLFFGYSSSSTDNNYKGYSFKQSDYGGWTTTVNGREYLFSHLPQNVEYLNISREAINSILSKPVLQFVFDPNHTAIAQIDAARLEYSSILANKNILLLPGITTKSDKYFLKIISCDNATKLSPMISIQESLNISVNYTNNCLDINAPAQITVQYLDYLRYVFLGIIV